MRAKIALRRWKQRLEQLMAPFFFRFQDKRRLERTSYAQFILKEELARRERDLKYLQFQLAKVRADNTELRLRQNELRPALADVLKQSNDELRQAVPYTVQIAEDGLAWETVTEVCCLGGCDLGVYTFPTERDALLFSALLGAVGYQPPHNIACSGCYTEYMKDFI